MTLKSNYKVRRMKAQTILRVAIVDVAVAERSPGAQVSTHPYGQHLAGLDKQIVKLRIRDVDVKVSHI